MKKKHILSKYGIRFEFHRVSNCSNISESPEQSMQYKENHINNSPDIHGPTYLTERIELSDPDEFI